MISAPTHKQARPLMAQRLFALGFDVTIPEAQLNNSGERPDPWGVAMVRRDKAFTDVEGNLVSLRPGTTCVAEYKRERRDAEQDSKKNWRWRTAYAYGVFRFVFVAGEVECFDIEAMAHFDGWGIIDLLTGVMHRSPLRMPRVAHGRELLMALQYARWINTGREPMAEEAPAPAPLSVDCRGNAALRLPEGWLGIAIALIQEQPESFKTAHLHDKLLNTRGLPKSKGAMALALEKSGFVKQSTPGGVWLPVESKALKIA